MVVAVIQHNSYDKAVYDGAFSVAHTLKAALTDTLPTAAQIVLDTVTNHPAPETAAGYPDGGYALGVATNATFNTSKAKATMARLTLSANGGDVTPFRYLVVYDPDNGDILLFSVDLGEEVTLTDGQTKLIDWNGTNPGIIANTL